MSAVELVDIAYAFTAASFAVILTRLLLRRLNHENFMIDDYLMLFATVFYGLNTAAWPITSYYETSITVKDPETLPSDQLKRVIFGSKWLLISRAFSLSYLCTLKVCILIFYTRLTARLNDRLAVKMALGLLVITWLTCLLIFLLECRPIRLFWQVLPGVPQCATALGSVIMVGTSNIVTSLVIMVIPLPIIFRAQLPLCKRLKIATLFLIWIFVIIISIVKMALTVEHPYHPRKVIWGQVESFSVTIAANAPIIHGLWNHAFQHIRQARFGQDSCAPAPEYTLSLRAETENKATQHRIEARNSRGSLRPSTGCIRCSFRKINRSIRRSFESLRIQQSTSIVQETRSGGSEHQSSEAVPTDIYIGPTKYFGHVSTEISCGTPPTTKSKVSWSGLNLHKV